MDERGIYSMAAGGVIAAGLWSTDEARGAINRLVTEGESLADLSVVSVCSHGEYGPDCPDCENVG